MSDNQPTEKENVSLFPNILSKIRVVLLFILLFASVSLMIEQVKNNSPKNTSSQEEMQVSQQETEKITIQVSEKLWFDLTSDVNEILDAENILSLRPLDEGSPLSEDNISYGIRYFTDEKNVFLVKKITNPWIEPYVERYSISLLGNISPESFSFKELVAINDPSQSIKVFFDKNSGNVYLYEHYCDARCSDFANQMTLDELYYITFDGVAFLADTDTALPVSDYSPYGFDAFESVDLETFSFVGVCDEKSPVSYFYKDKNSVYVKGVRKSIIDVDSFEFLGYGRLQEFAKDKNHIYLGCEFYIDIEDTSSFTLSSTINELGEKTITYGDTTYSIREFIDQHELNTY